MQVAADARDWGAIEQHRRSTLKSVVVGESLFAVRIGQRVRTGDVLVIANHNHLRFWKTDFQSAGCNVGSHARGTEPAGEQFTQHHAVAGGRLGRRFGREAQQVLAVDGFLEFIEAVAAPLLRFPQFRQRFARQFAFFVVRQRMGQGFASGHVANLIRHGEERFEFRNGFCQCWRHCLTKTGKRAQSCRRRSRGSQPQKVTARQTVMFLKEFFQRAHAAGVFGV